MPERDQHRAVESPRQRQHHLLVEVRAAPGRREHPSTDWISAVIHIIVSTLPATCSASADTACACRIRSIEEPRQRVTKRDHDQCGDRAPSSGARRRPLESRSSRRSGEERRAPTTPGRRTGNVILRARSPTQATAAPSAAQPIVTTGPSNWTAMPIATSVNASAAALSAARRSCEASIHQSPAAPPRDRRRKPAAKIRIGRLQRFVEEREQPQP